MATDDLAEQIADLLETVIDVEDRRGVSARAIRIIADRHGDAQLRQAARVAQASTGGGRPTIDDGVALRAIEMLVAAGYDRSIAIARTLLRQEIPAHLRHRTAQRWRDKLRKKNAENPVICIATKPRVGE